jgi:porphobilinogen synthase
VNPILREVYFKNKILRIFYSYINDIAVVSILIIIKKGKNMRLTTRLKKSQQIIRMVRPFELTPTDLIYPIFVREDGRRYEIPSMKGQEYLSLRESITVCSKVVDLGIPAIMIFAVLERKDADGLSALDKSNFNLEIFRTLKREFNDKLVLISNVCLCTYTTDENCVYSENGKVLNEKTSRMLGKIAVAHAEAGADIVAPAAMADGQVKYMRLALDKNGFDDVPIMTYIKADSCLFQPFFSAVSSSTAPRTGVDSSKFRTDVINTKMFLSKIDLDIKEGADIVIIKPALTNLDIILLTKQKYPAIPIAAYQVSGEYAMLRAPGVDEKLALLETVASIKRSGADMILTYDALHLCELWKTVV